MKINIATTPETAIIISRKESDSGFASLSSQYFQRKEPSPVLSYENMDSITRRLEDMFGDMDGDYFVHGQHPLYFNGEIVYGFYIEDKDGDKHTIFFKIA